MRNRMIAEIGASLVIVVTTGLLMVAGLVLGTYFSLSVQPFLKALGLILLLVGVENLPIFLLWCREMAEECASWPTAKVSAR